MLESPYLHFTIIRISPGLLNSWNSRSHHTSLW